MAFTTGAAAGPRPRRACPARLGSAPYKGPGRAPRAPPVFRCHPRVRRRVKPPSRAPPPVGSPNSPALLTTGASGRHREFPGCRAARAAPFPVAGAPQPRSTEPAANIATAPFDSGHLIHLQPQVSTPTSSPRLPLPVPSLTRAPRCSSR
jgi:hypothetical protein